MSKTRICRIGHLVEDIDATMAAFKALLDFDYRISDVGDFPLRVSIGEHGFEPIQTLRDFEFKGIDGPFLEVALEVVDVEATKRKLESAGYKVLAPNYLPNTDTWEYLFGPEFHGIPIMIANIGDQEAALGNFTSLEEAALPRLGCVVLAVDNVDTVAADMKTFFDMDFVETDPGGLGSRALVGGHRVKLVQRCGAAVESEFKASLAAFEVMCDDVEAVLKKFEAAGISPIHDRTFGSGRKGYYFGSRFQDLPIGIYSGSDDAEMIGKA
ncbi:MAG: hypothetical protein WC247_14430 [Porticoccaceae bacterium]|jgi:hypothetical protein